MLFRSTLLVDDASSDESVSFVRRRHPEVAVLSLPTNLGFLRTANLGMLIGLLRGVDYLLLLNNDTRLGKDSITPLLRAADAHPQYGVLGPIQTDFHGTPSPRTRAAAAGREPVDGLIDADWLEGSCLLIRREAIEQVGWLDPLYCPCD